MIENKVKRCKERECNGQIDFDQGVWVMTGCATKTPAYPCDTCGRLHWSDGLPVFNRQGNKAFLEDGGLTLKDKQNQIVGRV